MGWEQTLARMMGNKPKRPISRGARDKGNRRARPEMKQGRRCWCPTGHWVHRGPHTSLPPAPRFPHLSRLSIMKAAVPAVKKGVVHLGLHPIYQCWHATKCPQCNWEEQRRWDSLPRGQHRWPSGSEMRTGTLLLLPATGPKQETRKMEDDIVLKMSITQRLNSMGQCIWHDAKQQQKNQHKKMNHECKRVLSLIPKGGLHMSTSNVNSYHLEARIIANFCPYSCFSLLSNIFIIHI